MLVSASIIWKKNTNIKKFNQIKETKKLEVVRNGRVQYIDASDLLVGDIQNIQAGQIISGDGVLLEAHGIKVDVSSITG